MTEPADRPDLAATFERAGGRRRRRRRRAEAREEILRAAGTFLETHRFREMTVDALMQHTQMARPSFYIHFEDRHDVVAHLAGIAADELLAIARAHRSGAVHDLLPALVDAGCARRHVLRALLDASGTCEDVERVRNHLLAGVAECVARANRAGQARSPFERSVGPDTAFALVSMLEGLLLWATDAGDSDNVLRTVAPLWRRALAGAQDSGGAET